LHIILTPKSQGDGIL